MAAHGFADAQVGHIQNMITLQAGVIRPDVNTITSDAQTAFTAAQKEIVSLMDEATQKASRVDQSVRDMNDIKAQIATKIAEADAKAAAIEARILEHEAAIFLSGQAFGAAHDRLTALRADMDVYADQSAAVIKTIQQAADETRTQTMQEFQTWRSHTELWYEGIRSQVERATGSPPIVRSA